MDDLQLSEDHLKKLHLFVELILKWNRAYNLVSARDGDHLWVRHIYDSLQLISYLPGYGKQPINLFDLGSGAGFPGIVLAITTQARVTLVEKSLKKCQFLRTVAREVSLDCDIFQDRIENVIVSTKADVITSRALARLDILLDYSHKLLKEDGYCLFLKGEQVNQEIQEAQKKYSFHFEKYQGTTSDTNAILKVWRIFPLSSGEIVKSKKNISYSKID